MVSIIELFLGWKRCLRLSSPAITSALPSLLLNHVPNATSAHLLNTFSDGDSTASLASLLLTALSVKKMFLIPNFKLPWHVLRPFPLVVLLATRERLMCTTGGRRLNIKNIFCLVPSSCSLFLSLLFFCTAFSPPLLCTFLQTPSLCPRFWEHPLLAQRESLSPPSLSRRGCRSWVGEPVHVGWLQSELLHAASWHLLFGSCLFKCCEGFLHMANQTLRVYSCLKRGSHGGVSCSAALFSSDWLCTTRLQWLAVWELAVGCPEWSWLGPSGWEGSVPVRVVLLTYYMTWSRKNSRQFLY